MIIFPTSNYCPTNKIDMDVYKRVDNHDGKLVEANDTENYSTEIWISVEKNK